MPLQATSGAASYDGFGGGAPVAAKYIEDFFQTWLRTGTGSSTTVTTGLNASINKSLVWTKSRSAATNHKLTDTARGVTKALSSNTTGAEVTDSQGLTAFSSTGYTIGTNTDYNNSGATYVDWQWVATPKFFDVVTWTGNSTAGRQISHNLGSVPGCIFIKPLTIGYEWNVWHRSLTAGYTLNLNYTFSEQGPFPNLFGNGTSYVAPTSTNFTLGSDSEVNGSGETYVAYIFAHDAGGFGLTGTDNVISCGSFTTDGSGNATVNLGYEPQWLLIKNSSAAGYPWYMFDSMRGLTVGGNDRMLQANLNFAEENNNIVEPSATGFSYGVGPASNTFIYITIRRGPMKVPTDATKVFAPIAYTGDNSSNRVIGSLPAGDSALVFTRNYNDYGYPQTWWNRLTGGYALRPYNTNSEVNQSTTLGWDNQIGQLISVGSTNINYGGSPAGNFILYNFKRAPSFFDEVCWTGDGTNPRSISHNLTIAPTLIITKKRNSTSNWITGYDFAATTYKYFFLNDAGAANPDTYASTPVYGGNPTASVFIVGNQGNMNQSGDTYVSYLFATCAGVSKVGSYTGTGTTQQINCGFAAGARFVLIKRTDSTGDWYVWDSARGIVSGNDPYLLLNSAAAEVTNTDYVDTYSAGFEISSTAPAAINANGGSFIFFAVA